MRGDAMQSMKGRTLPALDKRNTSLHLLILALTIGLWTAVLEARAPGDNAGQQFTVKDLIGMSYFLTPGPIFSPDGHHFLVVTQRGILSSNKIEATLRMFDQRAVRDYLARETAVPPFPRILATFRARSNTPVITDIRWLADSRRVAFLAKDNRINQQLFIADISTGSLTRITRGDGNVSAYDVSGDTIAYSTLVVPKAIRNSSDGYVDATGKSLISLLNPPSAEMQDLNEYSIESWKSSVHLIRNGHEVPISFKWDGQSLGIFSPVLSLSPDGSSLITVAPVHEIPPDWELYRPWIDRDSQRLTPGSKFYSSDSNSRRAEEYVIVDLGTGIASALLNAPAGRVLQYSAPTKAIWLSTGRRVLLTNTFLAFDGQDEDHKEKAQRSLLPAVAVVNVFTRKARVITYLKQDPINAQDGYGVDDVSWNAARKMLEITYAGRGDKSSVPLVETYSFAAGNWMKVPSELTQEKIHPDSETSLSITEDLNHPPLLSGHLFNSGTPSLIWDPNPQLRHLRAGKVSLYRWKDETGKSWVGILALPPDYDPTRRYPLVIQTHGYRDEDEKYFADGEYTTGNGGRALAAKDLIVLQMEVPLDNLDTPTEAPEQLAGFEAAIKQLTAEGSVDPRRVGIIGFSRTCFHVLYAITHRPDLFAAASITNGFGMSYMEYLTLTDVPLAQEEFVRVNGGMPFGDGLSAWLRDAPGFNLDKVRTPLLVSAFESGSLLGEWEIYSGLRILGKPVDMVWLRKENAPHILVEPYQRYVSQQMSVDWFDFWLNHPEDTDPKKDAQYARWRELRTLIHGK
jgi:dipeptidyl aminopeptidase/acylaminoacyl peptidase